jgi:hypothetical protein
MNFEHTTTYDFTMILAQTCWDLSLVVIATAIFAAACVFGCAIVQNTHR